MRTLISFVCGFVLGSILLSVSASVTPKIIGGNGTLYGYTVVDEDGDEICSDPFVTGKELECE